VISHSQKLIHRDIKPENMLLGSDNEILLSDFGIATMAQSSRYQLTQEVVGTVSYMAPEQIQGKPRPASDEYSLGIVIYEWLTGSCPFQGSFTEIATQHVFAIPPPLREKLPAISPDVEQVLLMALAKDPQQRFASLLAFTNAFEQACGTGLSVFTNSATFFPLVPPIPSSSSLTPDLSQSELLTFMRPPEVAPDPTHTSSPVPRVLAAIEVPNQVPIQDTPPPSQKPPSTKTRYTRRMLLGGLGGLAVAGGGVLAWFMISQGSSKAANNPTPTATPSPTPTATATPSPTATATPAPTTSPPYTIRTYVTYPGQSRMYTAAWSPTNGTWIASGGQGRMVHVWDANSGTDLFSYDSHSSVVYRVAWSPDSKYLVSGHYDGTVQVWSATSGINVATYTGHTAQVNCVAWSPDGSMITSGSADRTAKVWSVATGNLLATYYGHKHYVNAVAWSPDSTYVVSGSGDATAQVWDAISGRHRLTYSGHTSEVLALAWSPIDGATIASASDDTTVQVWGAASGNPLRIYRNHTAEVEGVTWSPDSSKVASASDDTTVRVWQAT